MIKFGTDVTQDANGLDGNTTEKSIPVDRVQEYDDLAETILIDVFLLVRVNVRT